MAKNSNGETTECLCREIVPEAEFVEHACKCRYCQAIFGRFPETLFNSMKLATDDKAVKVLNALCSNAITNCEKKLTRFVKQPAPPRKANPPPPSAPEPVVKPLPNHPPAPVAVQPKPKPAFDMYEDDQDSALCIMCSGRFKDFSAIIYLENCAHCICKKDLTKHILQELAKSGTVKCPQCNVQLLAQEILLCIEKEKYEAIQNECTKKLIQSIGVISCPKCKQSWEHSEGKPDYNQKDDKGNKLSKIAVEDFAKFRTRCPHCNINFCSGCYAEPYHVGFTCEGFKSYQASRKCRYCKETIKGEGASSLPVFKDVCKKQECIDQMKRACEKTLPCKHSCFGFKDEKQCLPCLNEDCVKKNPEPTRDVKEDDYCPICYTSGLGDMPSIMPECGHICHYDCLLSRLKKRWPGPRITFAFCECPVCRKWASAPQSPEVSAEVQKIKETFEDIHKKAIDRLKYEGLDKDKRVHDPNDKYYNKPEEYALARLSYYLCFKCKKPYFGGLKSCDNVNEGQGEYKETDLVCGACASDNIKGGTNNCPQHGKDFIEFKCQFCCSVAQWFCWGNTHFCEPCHAKQCKGEYMNKIPKDKLPKCPGAEKCQLKINHPPNGSEYSLGCAVCRNNKANVKSF